MVNIPNDDVNLEGLEVCDFNLGLLGFLCGLKVSCSFCLSFLFFLSLSLPHSVWPRDGSTLPGEGGRTYSQTVPGMSLRIPHGFLKVLDAT